MSEQPRERCSVAARRAGDPLVGTAPPARRWLLIEHAGPWGRAGYAGSQLAPAVVRALSRWADTTGGRVVLIRRPGRGGQRRAEERRWFVADSRIGRARSAGGSFTDERELIDVAESSTGDSGDPLPPGHRPGATAPGDPASEHPLVLVCTHGRHDTCCAVRGRPTAAALADEYPERVWECSHIGGCRFAPAVVLLPHGFVLGTVPESEVAGVVARYRDGSIDTRWLRGRSSLTPVEQAAQQAARSQLGIPEVDAFRPVSVTGDDNGWRVTLADPDCTVHLTEHRAHLDRPLTCSMTRTGWQRTFSTIDVRPAR